MSGLVAEFEREMAAIKARNVGHPEREWLELMLMALEREAIVSVAYDDGVVLERLEKLHIDDRVRRLIRHAVIWVWKDEETHTTFTRGLLLKADAWSVRARALVQQLQGMVGGWSTAMSQHHTWGESPIARALASTVHAIGAVTGKVSKEVREHLRYGPFIDFCRFTYEAEVTAAVAWGRLVELARELPDVGEGVAAAFQRIQEDEDRHARLFLAFADAFTEDDALRPEVTYEGLAAQVREVGEYFLPVELRPTAVASHGLGSALGSAAPVWSIQGTPGDDKRALLRGGLDALDLAELVARRCETKGVAPADLRVAIKASFMLGYSHDDLSSVTDVSLVETLVDALRALGCRDVAVLEAPNLYASFFENRDVPSVARYFDYDRPAWRLVDAGAEQLPHDYSRGLGQQTVSRTWKEAHLRVTFGKLRSHPVDQVYLSLGNLDALGARMDDYLFTERLAQREAALMMILSDFPPHLAVIDGYDAAADGLVGVLGCPQAPAPRRLYLGRDALSVDLVAARHIGLADPMGCQILAHALHWFGRLEGDIVVHGADTPVPGWRSPRQGEVSTLLSTLAGPVYTFTSGHGSLFVPQMDPEAFPPRDESTSLKATRDAMRWIVGLG